MTNPPKGQHKSASSTPNDTKYVLSSDSLNLVPYDEEAHTKFLEQALHHRAGDKYKVYVGDELLGEFDKPLDAWNLVRRSGLDARMVQEGLRNLVVDKPRANGIITGAN